MTGTPTIRTWSNQSYSNSRSITFRAIETNHNNISVIQTNGKAINQCGTHCTGINGTFYYLGTPLEPAYSAGYRNGYVYRVSVQNGTEAHPGGLMNRLDKDSWGDCGTVLCFNYTVGGKKLACIDMTDFTNAKVGSTYFTASTVKWAVGGSNLYLDQSMTQTAFESAVASQDKTRKDTRHRSAVLINPSTTANSTSNNVILLTAFWTNTTGATNENIYKGVTLWELRQFCQNKYPGYVGINIDGGGSTAISYLQLDPLAVTFVHSGTSNSGPRLVPTMISTEMPNPI